MIARSSSLAGAGGRWTEERLTVIKPHCRVTESAGSCRSISANRSARLICRAFVTKIIFDLELTMDWHSRAVLAWRLSNTLGADFCVEALEDALARYDKPEVFNTDQGCQFTGTEFTSVLEHCGITISMDGKGRCMDNIFIERLWRSLKYEGVYLNAYASVAEATAGIGNWFRFYNEERQHQSLGYRTPQQTYAAECPWICGRSASPTGCASPYSRASSKSWEVLAFIHIPTRTTVHRRIDQKAFEGTVTSASMAIGADIEIRGATP